jgi:group I intron endonuclease
MRTKLGESRQSKGRGFVSVYLIRCLVSGRWYIGICVAAPAKRWADHCWTALRTESKTWLHRAIRKYGKEAFIIEHIASAKTWDDACAIERALIVQYDTFGRNGYNMTRGGDGTVGHIPSEETRTARSNKLKGRVFSEEHRRKISENGKASWTPERRARVSAQAKERMADPIYKANLLASHGTPGYRAKMGDKARGRKQTPEQRAATSARQKGIEGEGHTGVVVRRSGYKQRPETVAKRSASLMGHPVTQETRDRISAARVGCKQPPEAIAKMAASLRGRSVPQEVRGRISATMLQRHAERRQLAGD